MWCGKSRRIGGRPAPKSRTVKIYLNLKIQAWFSELHLQYFVWNTGKSITVWLNDLFTICEKVTPSKTYIHPNTFFPGSHIYLSHHETCQIYSLLLREKYPWTDQGHSNTHTLKLREFDIKRIQSSQWESPVRELKAYIGQTSRFIGRSMFAM